jgi:peptide/nickel transport system ATP-binding protein
VGLGSEILYRYPHEFSGGQRQRISIARSLILSPSFIVCDEITSALDVSNQAQVINLLLDLRATFELSLLFISHDLNVVGFISDYIAVMYLGKIVEFGSKTQILSNPLHPYTQALFGSSFDINKRKQKKQILSGEIPGILEKPRGCYFHTRCPLAKEVCKNEIPIWKKNSENHYTACHFT